MLIDVGTNAEVIVGNREWLIACAGAAGPALEGGVARMGMRAGPGAIEHVQIDPDSGEISYQTIGKGKPKGGMGSAPASGQGARARGGFSVTARESSIGNKAPPTAKGFIGGGRGTMESLRGRARGKSTMY